MAGKVSRPRGEPTWAERSTRSLLVPGATVTLAARPRGEPGVTVRSTRSTLVTGTLRRSSARARARGDITESPAIREPAVRATNATTRAAFLFITVVFVIRVMIRMLSIVGRTIRPTRRRTPHESKSLMKTTQEINTYSNQ